MRGSLRRVAAFAATGLLVLGVVACSSSGSPRGRPDSPFAYTSTTPLKAGENPASQVLTGPTKKRGGVLTAYTRPGFTHLDPGQSHSVLDYVVDYATQRPLFSYLPNTSENVSPDLATEIPTTANGGITDGARTVTVHIRKGVYFSPPVNREVTSADVAYAIERGANPDVANPYFLSYFGAASPAPLVGTQSSSYIGGPIPGIQTPNKFTIVFHTLKPSGSFLVSALTLPLSAPVPKMFATRLDKHFPTTYGTKYLVASGPYMLKSNPATGLFRGIGYIAGKSATLVRNPNWNPSADRRPAYLNEINIRIGDNATVIDQKVLSGSAAVLLGTPSSGMAKLAYQHYPAQITFTSGSGEHYVALDNAHGLFANVNVRRAVWANLNRAAIANARGGSLVADPATHFIYPGVTGFEQAGGYPGPQTAFNQNVHGDRALAETYMKAAGYKRGKYRGSQTVQIVSSSSGDDPAIARLLNSDLAQLGIKARVSLVGQSAMYRKYCAVTRPNIDACPALGWVRDFADPLTVLYATFYGPSIAPTNNSNFGQVNDPQINAAIKAAALVTDPAARAQAFANVDKMLVYRAVAIPEDFDIAPNIEAKNVAGVNAIWNEGTWDLSYTSLK
jgi:peptide/nickel transport system substrate-binding protein